MTEYDKKCSILAELWVAYRQESSLEEFIAYNDLGLPLAYAVTEELVISNQETENIVAETWDMLIAALDVRDVGFDTLEKLLSSAE